MEISVGAILEGTIKSITKFGAFVTLPGGRSGLVHISEIAHSYVENVSDFLSEGQTVKVKVVNIDEAGRTLTVVRTRIPFDDILEVQAEGESADSAAGVDGIAEASTCD